MKSLTIGRIRIDTCRLPGESSKDSQYQWSKTFGDVVQSRPQYHR